MNLEHFVLTGLILFLSFWVTGRLYSPSSSLYILDHPNERSLHTQPIPRTGGLAILGSLVIGLVLIQITKTLGWTDPPFETSSSSLSADNWRWILGMALVIGVVSFWDDRVRLPAVQRLGIHGLAAIGAVWGGGMSVESFTIPLFGTLLFGWAAIPLTVLFLMWMTNLYNFMDGMDGLAGGMTVLGFGFLSYTAWTAGHQPTMIVSLLIAGSTAGFLSHNWPPARIFMGDVGSVSLGFLAAALSVKGIQDGLFDVWVPVLIFSPFIVDATVTLIRRMIRGEKVWQAHREHYYQRLVLAGWSHRKTVLAEYVLMLACGVSAVIYHQSGEAVRSAVLLGLAGIYALLGYAVKMIEKRREAPTGHPQE